MIVNFSDVVIVYDNFPALAGASFEIASGEIVLLQGPNGAGKTTLLRACAGLLPIARGTATVLGCDLGVEALCGAHESWIVGPRQRIVSRFDSCRKYVVLVTIDWCIRSRCRNCNADNGTF